MRSIGASRPQRSSPRGQRPWKRQACGGGSIGLETSPDSLIRGPCPGSPRPATACTDAWASGTPAPRAPARPACRGTSPPRFSVSRRTTFRSCAHEQAASAPARQRSRASSCSTTACTETSSAAVGSSRIKQPRLHRQRPCDAHPSPSARPRAGAGSASSSSGGRPDLLGYLVHPRLAPRRRVIGLSQQLERLARWSRAL